MIYVGVDLHQRFCYMTAMDASGAILDHRQVPNDQASFLQYFQQWSKPLQVAVEACSFWQAFVDRVEPLVTRLTLVHPQRVKAIASAKLKNDRVDSETLAHLLRANLLPESWIADRKTRELRQQTRLRVSLGQARAQWKNKVQAVLHQQGLRPPVSDLFGRKGRLWLGEQRLPVAARQSVDTYLELIDHLDQKISWEEQQLRARAETDSAVRHLTSIPGIGRTQQRCCWRRSGMCIDSPTSGSCSATRGWHPGCGSRRSTSAAGTSRGKAPGIYDGFW
jgi:transposase